VAWDIIMQVDGLDDFRGNEVEKCVRAESGYWVEARIVAFANGV
jgi:hypothetical protein